MSSRDDTSQPNKRGRVRFANVTDQPEEDNNALASPAKKKKKDHIYHVDELDDIDEFDPSRDDGDFDPNIPSEHELLLAKQKRRQKQQQITDDLAEEERNTTIDQRTSLATEGIEVEPFHMQNETQDGTGYFDGDTYVFRKRDTDEEPDAWLESLGDLKTEEFIPNDRVLRPANETQNSSSQDDVDLWTPEELYAKVLPLVSDTETVAQAIVRYGNLIQHTKKNPQQTNAKMAQQALNELTEAANALLLQGKVDIYQSTRNDILKMLPSQPVVQWEYQGSQDGQIHGPFSTQQMHSWIQQGYFVGPSAVKIRTVAEQEMPAKDIQQDLLDDLLDDEENLNKESIKIRSEWMQSDKVDFSKYG